MNVKTICYSFLISSFFWMLTPSLIGQVRLDVAGDAKFEGKIQIINAPGDSSIFIGHAAGLQDDGSNRNVFIGNRAGQANTSGASGTFIGDLAGSANTTGAGNTFIGQQAGLANTTGFFNTIVGGASGRKNTTGQENTFMGVFAGEDNTSGGKNTFVGTGAGRDNTEGSTNSFFGLLAGGFNTIGERNTFIGTSAGNTNTTGNRNTFIGRSAGYYNTTGYQNTFLGHRAGLNNFNGDNNLFLGTDADALDSDSLHNAIAIGYAAKVDCHNCAVLGGTDSAVVKVGIAMNQPLWPFHINNEENAIKDDSVDISALTTVLAKPNNDNGAIGLGFQNSGNRNSIGAAIIHERTGSASNGKLHFATKSDGVSASDIPIHLTLDEIGQLGLGKTDPFYPLHLINAKNALTGSNVDISELAMVVGRAIDSNNEATGIGFQHSSSTKTVGAAIIHERTGSASRGKLHFATKSGGVVEADIPIRVTIDESGNLGINTETPAEKLDVNGKAIIRDVPLGIGSEDFVRIDANGNLFRSSAIASRQIPTDKQSSTIEDQKVLLQAKEKAIQDLQTAIDQQNQQIQQLQNQLTALQEVVDTRLTNHRTRDEKSKQQLSLLSKARLAQNQPNPFHTTTIIPYELPTKTSNAYLRITTLNGTILGEVKLDKTKQGQVEIKANSYPAGIYLYALIVDGQVIDTKRMVLTQ